MDGLSDSRDSVLDVRGAQDGDEILSTLSVRRVIRDTPDERVLLVLKPEKRGGRPVLLRLFKGTETALARAAVEITWFRLHRPWHDWLHSYDSHFFLDETSWLLINQPLQTLEDVMTHKELWPLSRRHVCEIVFQLFRAISFLHGEMRFSGDINPENIEFVQNDRLTEIYYDPSLGIMRERTSLKSVEVRLAYYGTFDLDHTAKPENNIYRAPEANFGWNCDSYSDLFSVGVVIGTLVTGRPLFQPRFLDSHRIDHMAFEYQCVLGRLPYTTLQDLRDRNGLDISVSGVAFAPRLEQTVAVEGGHLEGRESCSLEEQIEDEDAFDLISSLLSVVPPDRVALSKASCYRFFDTLRADAQSRVTQQLL